MYVLDYFLFFFWTMDVGCIVYFKEIIFPAPRGLPGTVSPWRAYSLRTIERKVADCVYHFREQFYILANCNVDSADGCDVTLRHCYLSLSYLYCSFYENSLNAFFLNFSKHSHMSHRHISSYHDRAGSTECATFRGTGAEFDT